MRCAMAVMALALAGTIPAVPNCETSSRESVFDATMTISKKYPTAGKPVDFLVRIKNISTTGIMIDTDATRLLYPVALSSGRATTKAEDYSVGYDTVRCNYVPAPEGNNHFYRMEPNDETVVECPTTNMKSRNFLVIIGSEFDHYITFHPGDFKVAIVIHYTRDLQDPEPRVSTFETEVPIETPQSVILLGAVIGAFLAYLLSIRKRPAAVLSWPRVKRRRYEVLVAVYTILLSAVVTILLARLSENQFVIKVSVEDLWGAITVGFVAGYLGSNAFDGLFLGSSSKPAESDGQS